jgi:hypothetical protein
VSSGVERELDLELVKSAADRVFGDTFFNLIRRGADGSLRLSADHWRLDEASDQVFRFTAREPEAPALIVEIAEVERVVWERLPKQQARSQIRFFFASGDVWTFSGSVDESALPER